jgi:phosphoserine aminotransferase
MIPYVTDTPDIAIPTHLLPADGRFGAGPSKVRPEAVEALAQASGHYLGTSHRQKTVKAVVGSLREGLRQLFSLPSDYEVVLGNGGTTTFWDAATFGLIDRKSQHLTFGEFSSKFATTANEAPHLDDPQIISSEVGTHPVAVAREDIDLYALTHNETSTGVMMPILRPEGAQLPSEGGGLVAVDATSGAGGLRVDPAQFDAYYFAPQKCFGSDGGLWVALLSPAAQNRITAIAATKRWVPASLDLTIALDNSKLDQTYNTPALATLFLMDHQVRWFNENGGLEFSAGRCDKSSEILYTWADSSDFATPFVSREQDRSRVVGTIDFVDSVDAAAVAAVLRANGIVDTEPYRKLGRNQLRIAMFPAIDPDDVASLCACINYVPQAESLGGETAVLTVDDPSGAEILEPPGQVDGRIGQGLSPQALQGGEERRVVVAPRAGITHHHLEQRGPLGAGHEGPEGRPQG